MLKEVKRELEKRFEHELNQLEPAFRKVPSKGLGVQAGTLVFRRHAAGVYTFITLWPSPKREWFQIHLGWSSNQSFPKFNFALRTHYPAEVAQGAYAFLLSEDVLGAKRFQDLGSPTEILLQPPDLQRKRRAVSECIADAGCREKLDALGISSETDSRAIHELNWEMLNYLRPLKVDDIDRAVGVPLRDSFEALASKGLQFLAERAAELVRHRNAT